jgi:hypothetical protein
MRRAAGEQGASTLALKVGPRQPLRRAQTDRSKARHRERMAWRAQWPEDLFQKLGRRANQRLEQAPVGLGVPAKAVSRLLQGTLEHYRGAVVEGMRQRRVGMHQLEAVLGERQAAHERGCKRQRVHRGAGVVNKARKRQLLGAAAPADGLRSFEDCHPPAGPGEDDRRGEAVRARADDDGLGSAIRQPRGRA